MLGRCLLIASTALAMTGAVAAEPAKPGARPNSEPATRPAQVVLASAEQVEVPAPAAADSKAAAPVKKPRAARVTSCRCGGQTDH